MADNTARIARSLIGVELPSADIATAMLQMAEVRDAVAMPTAPVGPGAKLVAKTKGWAKSATLASSSTDPAMLTSLAKHSSKQVRRIVARNEATPAETIVQLINWALAKDDDETIAKMLDRNEPPVAEIVDALENHRGASRPRYFPANRLAALMANDPELVVQGLRYDEPRLIEALIDQVATRKTDVAFDTARACITDPHLREMMTAKLAEHSAVCDDMLVNFIDRHELVDKMKQVVGRRTASYETVDAAAARRLIALVPAAADWVLSGVQGSDELFAEFAELATIERLCHLTRYGRNLSDANVRTIVEQMHLRGPKPGDEFSTQRPRYSYGRDQSLSSTAIAERDMSSEDMLDYLRMSDSSDTASWLRGEFLHKPQPGDVAALIADPVWALGRQQFRDPATGIYKLDAGEIEALQPTLSGLLRTVELSEEEVPWLDELVDAAEAFGIRVAVSCPTYLATRLTDALGDNQEAWRHAVNMLAVPSTSLTDMLTTVQLLNGISADEDAPIEEPANQVEEDQEAGELVQGVLL